MQGKEQEQLASLARDVEGLKRAIEALQSGGTIARVETAEGDVPPEPPRVKGTKSRSYVGERGKLSGTADQALLDLFEAERKARGVSLSRMIDIILWKYFDRPQLSFERSELSEE